MTEKIDSAENHLYDRLITLGPLLKILECPVCLEVVKVPFKMCKNGHLICEDCMKTLPSCPYCKAEFSLTDPVCVKQLIEALPRPCPYAGAGCKEVNEPDSDHRAYCGFRPVECRQCWKKSTPLCQFEQHWRSDHAGLPFHTKKTFQIRLGHFQEATRGFAVPIFHNMPTLFWLTITAFNWREVAEIKFDAVSIGKLSNDYFITLKFIKGQIGHTVSVKALDVNNKAGEAEEGIGSTSIAHSTAKRCVNELGQLVVDCVLYSKRKANDIGIKAVN